MKQILVLEAFGKDGGWRESVSMASLAASEARVSEIDGLDAISLDLEPDVADSHFGSVFGSEDFNLKVLNRVGQFRLQQRVHQSLDGDAKP